MTTILGINCLDRLVICSESQQTYGDGLVRQAINKKILSFKENETCYCSIAGAGEFEYTEKFISKLHQQAKANYLNYGNTLIAKSENIVNDITNRYIVKKAEDLGLFTRQKELILNYEYWIKMIDKYIDLGLICGFLIKRKENTEKGLFFIGNRGIAKKIIDYDIVGTGSTIAEYFLSKFWSKDIDISKASYLAIYIMNEVRNIDSKSGDKTQVSIINNKGFVKFADIVKIKKDYEKYINNIGKSLKVKWVYLLTNPDIVDIEVDNND